MDIGICRRIVEGGSHVFGSSELNSEKVRSARFSVGADGYAPDEVHAFLEQIASAVDVLLAEPGPAAVRAELMRVQETTANMVLASQEAADRLRQNGAEDARSIVEESKKLAEELRDRAEREFSGAREHVETVRTQFIQELRDMYDRIGATLYRFEHAEKQAVAAPSEPAAATQYEQVVEHAPEPPAELPPDPLIPSAPAAEPAPAADEPLVDLRGMTEPAPAPAAPEPATAAPVEETPLGTPDFTPAAAEPEDAGGGWLINPDAGQVEGTGYVDAGDSRAAASAARLPDDEPSFQPEASFEPATPMVDPNAPLDPQAAADNARAEALLAGMDAVVANAATTPEPAPLPPPPSLTPEPVPAEPAPLQDPAAIKSFVLQSLSEGSPRDAIESYLRTNLGIADPGGTIDSILAESQG
jgi:DivIVA domain-containing protein